MRPLRYANLYSRRRLTKRWVTGTRKPFTALFAQVCEAFGLDGFAVAIGELITRVGTRDIDTASPACQLLEQMVQRLLPTESCGAVIAQGILQSPHNSEGAALDELCSKAVRLAISGEIRLLLALLESECYSDLREQGARLGLWSS